jgi:hypothetical protein
MQEVSHLRWTVAGWVLDIVPCLLCPRLLFALRTLLVSMLTSLAFLHRLALLHLSLLMLRKLSKF